MYFVCYYFFPMVAANQFPQAQLVQDRAFRFTMSRVQDDRIFQEHNKSGLSVGAETA